MLRGVDFDVARGGIFALLGSNGAGKTTVAKILATVLKVDAGTGTADGGDGDGRRRGRGRPTAGTWPVDGGDVAGRRRGRGNATGEGAGVHKAHRAVLGRR